MSDLITAVAMAVVAVVVVAGLVWAYTGSRGGTNIKNLIRPRRRR